MWIERTSLLLKKEEYSLEEEMDLSRFDEIAMIDRVGLEDLGPDNYSDYGSPESLTDSLSDINVKEALRTTISQKATILKPKVSNLSMHLSTLSSSEQRSGSNSESDLEAELDLHPKKGRKPKVEDEETAAVRRERNRLAAQRCRQRRRDRIEKLEKICGRLQSDGDKLQLEITDLQKELDKLQRLLTDHKCLAKPIKTEIFMPIVKT